MQIRFSGAQVIRNNRRTTLTSAEDLQRQILAIESQGKKVTGVVPTAYAGSGSSMQANTYVVLTND